MKTLLSNSRLCAFTFLIIASASACAEKNSASTSPDTDPASPASAADGGPVAAEREEVTSLRLLGVEAGDSPANSYAVVARTRSWHTEVVKMGATLGRKHRLISVTDKTATFMGPMGKVELRVGQDLQVPLKVHRYDDLLTHEGNHRWIVDETIAREIVAANGLGVTVKPQKLYGKTALQITGLTKDGLFDRLHFHVGDLMFSHDDAPITEAQLTVFAETLQSIGSKATRIQIVRKGATMNRLFRGASH